MSEKEISGVSMLLLMAGHETTANNLALGVLALVENPQWIGDERATEELLRYYSVADVVALRVATEDVEIAGQLIKAGEGIVPLIAAANHDEVCLRVPAHFDPGRSASRHVAFGFGSHQCLGQNLVRIEMDVAYRTLFEQDPQPADRRAARGACRTSSAACCTACTHCRSAGDPPSTTRSSAWFESA